MTQEKETNRQAEQGKAETEIPCAVCRDLIPLVQDGVAGKLPLRVQGDGASRTIAVRTPPSSSTG